MENVFTRLNMLLATSVTVLTYLLGAHWYVFVAYMCLNILDYFTGSAKARRNKEVSSSRGMDGIKKKVYYWVLIALAFLAPWVLATAIHDMMGVDLSMLMSIGWFTMLTMFINEVRSVLENLVELGVEVPKVLVKGLDTAEKALNSKEEDS